MRGHDDKACAAVEKAWLSSEPLSAAAAEHLRQCPFCARLAGWMRKGPEAPLDAALEARLASAAAGGLAPVKPIAGAGRYALVLLAAAAAIVILALARLGLSGWIGSGWAIRVYLGGWVAAGLILGAMHLARLMVPGTALTLRPGALAWVAAGFASAAVLLYPLAIFAHFWRAAGACFSIGTTVALVTALVTIRLLKRGYVTDRPKAARLLGLFSGFTGLAVLFLFCPHVEAGHFLVAHATVALCFVLLVPVVWRLADR